MDGWMDGWMDGFVYGNMEKTYNCLWLLIIIADDILMFETQQHFIDTCFSIYLTVLLYVVQSILSTTASNWIF